MTSAVGPIEAVSLSSAQFAALGRLAGAEALLDGWLPEISVPAWFAVVDGLAARGLLASADGGATYRATAASRPLIDPVAEADRAWSALAETDDGVLGRLVLGAERSLVGFDLASEDGPVLAPIAQEVVPAFLLDVLGLEDAGTDPTAAVEHQVGFDAFVAALAGEHSAGLDQPTLAHLTDFARALSAATSQVRFERRLQTPVGVVVDHCSWFDGGDLGCWRMHPSGDTVSFAQCTRGQLRSVVLDLLDG